MWAAADTNQSIARRRSPALDLEGHAAEPFFGEALTLLSRNPPLAADADMLSSMRALGLAPGMGVAEVQQLSLRTRLALRLAKRLGVAAVKLSAFSTSTNTNGWRGIGGNIGTCHLLLFDLNS